MEVIFVYKAFEDATTCPGNQKFVQQIQFIDIEKFALCVLD